MEETSYTILMTFIVVFACLFSAFVVGVSYKIFVAMKASSRDEINDAYKVAAGQTSKYILELEKKKDDLRTIQLLQEQLRTVSVELETLKQTKVTGEVIIPDLS